MKKNNIFKLIIAIVVSQSAGAIGSVFTVSAIPSWYEGLIKPAINPPNWVFGPAWVLLYTIMGIAAFLVWKNGLEKKEIKIALGVFCFQLFLNTTWSIVFFGLQSPGWALINIIILFFAIIWTMIVFYRVSRKAAYLFLPYLVWVSFAAYLNYSIWALN